MENNVSNLINSKKKNLLVFGAIVIVSITFGYGLGAGLGAGLFNSDQSMVIHPSQSIAYTHGSAEKIDDAQMRGLLDEGNDYLVRSVVVDHGIKKQQGATNHALNGDKEMHGSAQDQEMNVISNTGLYEDVVGELPNLLLKPKRVGGGDILLQLEVQNFTFSPEQIDADLATQNQGFAQISIDGKDFGRIYGNRYHIPSQWLKENSTIQVTLHADNSKVWRNDGKIIHAIAHIK